MIQSLCYIDIIRNHKKWIITSNFEIGVKTNMQDCYERFRLSDYADPSDAILHSIIYDINYKVSLHNHSYYEVFLLFLGEMYHEVNGELQDIPCYSVIFIRPEDRHRYYQKGSVSCGLIRLWLTPQIFDSLTYFLGNSLGLNRLLAEKLPPVLSITEVDMQGFLDRFEAIFSLSPLEETKRISSLKLILLEIVLLLLGYIEKVKKEFLPPWLEQLCNEMSLKCNFTLGIDRLFQLSHVSREHLSRSFKKYLAITPTEYIKRLRLNYAANQLANTNMKIVDICFDSGFGNMSYFYDCFTKSYGLTPNSYRASKLSHIDMP